ncbi:ubiquinone biosynthesis protein [Arthrobacter alpinus]|uniref:class I SAM-dependent methyltransferase n=1 Tax=Arthrobacter alpinus TaxID=656366 RepID=UPI0005CB7F88|nr:class I SAM-dependent methyltransferase [Arthrobacter alpinus]ALV45975.1 ubiquinone biosynthesis protein [Arthrobacter alpinus]
MAGTGGPVFDAERRKHMATAFLGGGDHYHKVRPGYPEESLSWLVEKTGPHIEKALDVGAGTGKYTQLLVRHGWAIMAVDPSVDMLAQLAADLPQVTTLVGTAEHLALPDASADLVVVAQAWHWCDPLAASTEIARVLRSNGTLGLIWNQLDVGIPWVHRLARIMHAGDVHKPDFRPEVGPEFSLAEPLDTPWVQAVTAEEIMELAKSRSYYLKASETVREKVLSNLHWYLFDHLGYAPGEVLDLPYVAQTWRAYKA